MKTLFIIPGACSFGSMVALEWAKVPYKIGVTTPEIRASEAFRKVNPIGKVGALQDGDMLVYENAAILLYLIDKYPQSKIAVAVNTKKRVEVYSWLSYLASTLHVTGSMVFNPTIFVDESDAEKFKEKMLTRLKDILSYINSCLKKDGYFIGELPTIIDAQAYGLLRWSEKFGLLQQYSAINQFMLRMKELSTVQNALNIEQQKTDNLVNSSFAGYYTFPDMELGKL